MSPHEPEQKALSKTIQVQFDQQVDFLKLLVRAKSANLFTPETVSADTPVEKEVALVTQRELHRLGFDAELAGATSQRPNVLCHIPGSGKTRRTLLLTTHMDTVDASEHYTRDPWGAQIDQGRLYGVGTADAKAQIAAFIYAMSALRTVDLSLAGDVTLAFVVDEETGACSPYGTRYLFEQGLLQGDAAIVSVPLCLQKLEVLSIWARCARKIPLLSSLTCKWKRMCRLDRHHASKELTAVDRLFACFLY